MASIEVEIDVDEIADALSRGERARMIDRLRRNGAQETGAVDHWLHTISQMRAAAAEGDLQYFDILTSRLGARLGFPA